MQRLAVIMICLAVVGGWIRLTASARIKASCEARDIVESLVDDLPSYENDAEFFEHLIEENHQRVFDVSYVAKNQGAQPEFDEVEYIDGMLSSMALQALKEDEALVGTELSHLNSWVIANLEY